MATVGERTAAPSLWRNRDYVLLAAGQTVSLVGTEVSQIAYPLLVLALTGSPAQAGLVAAARTVPYLLIGLPAGAMVDRWDRKLTMRLCSAASGLALASVAVAHLLGVLTVAQLIAVSFVEGGLSILFGLAETSALPRVVPKPQLPAAAAQLNVQYSIASLLGPPLGGTLYAVSAMAPFLLDAVSYLLSALSLGFVRTAFQPEVRPARQSLVAEIRTGVGWLWRQPTIRAMAFLTGAFHAAAGLTLVIIVLATRQGASSAEIGAIFAAAGVGGIAGSAASPWVQARFSFGQVIIAVSWFTALWTGTFAFAGSPLASAILLTIMFAVMPAYDTVQYSYRLALIPDALQGRVNSAFRLVAIGMRPLGLALTGLLLERFGPEATALTLAAWLVAACLVTTFNPHIRHAPPVPKHSG